MCDVSALTDPDAVAVEALARLQLTARRLGRRILILGAGPALEGLLELTGLREVLPSSPPLAFEAGREREEREPPLGVEEEGDPGDPIA